ncbi:MAG: hypothetical protein IJ318_00175 [Clostridia bacterium]|nr:hypothetical protein [Clostridia bacterium]
MKNKFRLWINIVTICLCVCAIAIGVYSATTANLNVGGKIAFSAHNCKVDITAYIYGHAEGNDDDGLPVAEAQKEPLNGGNALSIEGGVSTTEQCKLDLGTRYFTDMASTDGSAEDIVIGITVKNTSAYKITAKTVTHTLPTRVTASANQDTADIDPQGTTTFVFTLELQPDTPNGTVYSSITTLQDLVLALKFEKWEEPFIKSDTIQNTADARYGDGTTTYYYIEMGTNPYTGEKLRWVPIAEYDTTTSTYKLFEKTSKPEEGKTYYFISEYILDVESATNYGLSYNFYNNLATSYSVYYNGGDASTLDGYTTHTLKPYDYSSSNIRAYLNSNSDNPAYRTYSGNTANAGSAKTYYPNTTTALTGDKSFLTYFEISSDSIYNMITARPLESAQNGATFSLYSDTGTTSATATKTAGVFKASSKTISGKTISTSATDSDKLWCLSYYEACNFLGQKDATLTSSSDTYKVSYKLPTTSLAGDGTFTGTASNWWLRTPRASFATYEYLVNAGGSLVSSDADGANGVRPAFQITIPA